MRRLHTAIRRLRRLRDADGASMLEAAIVTPLLLLLTIGIIEFGVGLLRLARAAERCQPGDPLRASPATRWPAASRVDSIKAAMRTGDADAGDSRQRLRVQPPADRRHRVRGRHRRAGRSREGDHHLHVDVLHAADASVLSAGRMTHARSTPRCRTSRGSNERRQPSAGRSSTQRGQSLVEFAIIMPLFLIIVLGIVEVGYALVDQHVTTRMTREGSNLISRDTPLPEAAAALRSMTSAAGQFRRRQLEADPLGAEAGRDHRHGQLRQDLPLSALRVRQLSRHQQADDARAPARSAGPTTRPPTRTATPGLQLTSGPANIVGVRGGLIYVTEIYTRHRADHTARSIRHPRAADSVFDCVFLRHRADGCQRGNGMSRQQFRTLERTGLRPDLHGRHADGPAAVRRPRRRCRPRLRGQGAAVEGGGRRRAGRRAHAEQRRSARRGGAHLRGQLSVRLHGHRGRQSHRGRQLLLADHRHPGRREHRHRSRATATLPTTFMRLARLNTVTIASSGEAQRRMVDLSLVLDVSSSIGSRWARSATRRAPSSTRSTRTAIAWR